MSYSREIIRIIITMRGYSLTRSMGTLNYRRKREWNHIKLRHSFLIDGREDERTLLQYARKRFDR